LLLLRNSHVLSLDLPPLLRENTFLFLDFLLLLLDFLLKSSIFHSNQIYHQERSPLSTLFSALSRKSPSPFIKRKVFCIRRKPTLLLLYKALLLSALIHRLYSF